MVKRTFVYKSEDIILQLYKSLVRLRQEFCIQTWSPHLRKYIDQLEKVQSRAIRLIYTLNYLPCEIRLERIQLSTLETRTL